MGNYIVISHPDGRQSRYLHLSSRIVKTVGATVGRGAQIGYSGGSGFSSDLSAHLHYDEQINGSRVTPGSMKARHGNSIVQYPHVFGYTYWYNLPAWSARGLRNDSFR